MVPRSLYVRLIKIKFPPFGIRQVDALLLLQGQTSSQEQGLVTLEVRPQQCEREVRLPLWLAVLTEEEELVMDMEWWKEDCYTLYTPLQKEGLVAPYI